MVHKIEDSPQVKKEAAVMDELLALIKAEAYPEGARLPSERSLAAQLGTSRNTLRGAIRRLETMGLVDIRRGSGTYVRRKDDSLRQWQTFTRNESTISIQCRLEAGFLFQPIIGAMAAKRIGADQLAALKQCVVKLSRAIIDGRAEQVAVEDARFRMIVAAGTGNPVLAMTMQQFEPLGRKTCLLIAQLSQKERERFFADYVEMLNAIKEKNPELVRLRFSNNLKRMGRYLQKYGGITLPGPMAEDYADKSTERG